MYISLRLKTNLRWSHIFLGQTDLCADAQLNLTVCCFADIISLRRRHNSLGPIRAIGEHFVNLKFQVNKISELMFTYGGIRALNISNLAASAYGLSLGFL